jgi:hypothetical protein
VRLSPLIFGLRRRPWFVAALGRDGSQNVKRSLRQEGEQSPATGFSLAVGLEVGPKLRPRLAWGAADVNVWVIFALLIFDRGGVSIVAC